VTGQLGIDGQEQPDRVCACRCGRSLEGKRRDAVWYSRACAVRWARSNPGKSLYVARSANKGQTRTRRSRSGLQVSYRRMVDVLEDLFTYQGLDYPRTRAVNAVRYALSDRQKALLTERKRAQRAPTLTVAEQRQAFSEMEEATHV
jgi:hypothetical protein